MGIRECAWLTISVIVMLMQINIVDAMYKSQNKLKLCFKDKSSCISSSKWDHLTCDESCVCQGHFYGLCQYSGDVCIRSRPWTCNCYGTWIGSEHTFCSKRYKDKNTETSDGIQRLP